MQDLSKIDMPQPKMLFKDIFRPKMTSAGLKLPTLTIGLGTPIITIVLSRMLNDITLKQPN
jgi:hypothetical protein